MRQCYIITQSAKIFHSMCNFLTVRDKRKLPGVISSWKNWDETVVKISAQPEHFYVLILKVSHSKFWLFQPIFRHLDPNTDPDPGSVWITIQPDPKHCLQGCQANTGLYWAIISFTQACQAITSLYRAVISFTQSIIKSLEWAII